MKTNQQRSIHSRNAAIFGCVLLLASPTALFGAPSPSPAGTPHQHATAPDQNMTMQDQIAELRRQVARLQAALDQKHQGMTPPAQTAANSMDMMAMMQGMMNKKKMMGMENMAGGSIPGMNTPNPGSTGMEDMDMMGQMSDTPAAMQAMQSGLPGFPGASHLYHIGATGFFTDHPQHIALSTEQQNSLNKMKEQAELAKASAERNIEKAEQELWTLTAADQPDIGKIDAKVREIEKLRADERLAFIRSVGEAAKLLTADQRKMLTGFMSPAPAAAPSPSPAMSPMQDM
jgi:Spy/CpxP family protein refolding chaperone